jgi:hypothetical protein
VLLLVVEEEEEVMLVVVVVVEELLQPQLYHRQLNYLAVLTQEDL